MCAGTVGWAIHLICHPLANALKTIPQSLTVSTLHYFFLFAFSVRRATH